MSAAAVRSVSSACALAALAGCSDYLARRDTLTLGTGEAVQSNMVMHTIDPWPLPSRRIDPYTDGERMQRAIERYRNPVVNPTGGPPVPSESGTASTASNLPPATP